MGNVCDWISIRNIADKYNLKVIEDSADTLGAVFANGNQQVTTLTCPLQVFMDLILLTVLAMEGISN